MAAEGFRGTIYDDDSFHRQQSSVSAAVFIPGSTAASAPLSIADANWVQRHMEAVSGACLDVEKLWEKLTDLHKAFVRVSAGDEAPSTAGAAGVGLQRAHPVSSLKRTTFQGKSSPTLHSAGNSSHSVAGSPTHEFQRPSPLTVWSDSKMLGGATESNWNMSQQSPFLGSDEYVADYLPDNWPRCLELRPGLERQLPTMSHKSTQLLSPNMTSRTHGRATRAQKLSQMLKEDDKQTKSMVKVWSLISFILHDPDSKARMVWKWISTLGLLYEAVLIPYLLGFEIAFEGWIPYQLFLMAVLWTVDMCWNFLQGYESDGILITDTRLTTLHYLSRGFALDIFVVALDWTTAIIVSFNTGQLQTVARVLRLFRMAGLVRLQKLARLVLEHVLTAEVDATQSVGFMMGIIIGSMLLFNHLQACVWAYVGRHAKSDTGAHWVDMTLLVGMEEMPYQDLNPVFQYTSIFHWHMAQLTVGNQSIQTANTVERLVNIIGLVIALMSACTVVSMLSATLVSFQFSVRQRNQQLRTLQQYLIENDVSRRTFVAAVKQARERLRKSARIQEKDVSALALLPRALVATLRHEIALPLLQTHNFFRLWARLDHVSAQQLCVSAVGWDIVLPNEMLFQAGEVATSVYHMKAGKAEYRLSSQGYNMSGADKMEQLHAPAWIAEAAQWASWIHVGSFEAMIPCEVFWINASRWVSTLPGFHPLRDVATDYAAQYCKRLFNAVPPGSHWPDDLQVPFTTYGELLFTMGQRSREVVGIDALKEASVAQKVPMKKLDTLEHQLLTGQCVLFSDLSGQLKRVTAGVSLEIMNEEGKLLFQLGKVMESEVITSLMVPGHMSIRDENPLESVERLLRSKLSPLAKYVHLSQPKEETETKMSKAAGIETDYRQLRFAATLRADYIVPVQFHYGDASLMGWPSDMAPSTLSGSERAFPSSPQRSQEVALPDTLVFPSPERGACYCFAWLTKADFLQLGQRNEVVERWLRRIHGLRPWLVREDKDVNESYQLDELTVPFVDMSRAGRLSGVDDVPQNEPENGEPFRFTVEV